jgi:hypothetical protein
MAYDRQPPQYRASDADREAAAERLHQAAVEGRLDTDELDERLAAAYRSKTVAELQSLTLDLIPPPAPPVRVPPAYPAQPAPIGKTNGFAVASLVLGICWVWWIGSVLAVVFGHVALGQIKQSQGRQSGTGLAIAGLVLGYLGIATVLVVLLAAAIF